MAKSDLNPDVTESKAQTLPIIENIFSSKTQKLRACLFKVNMKQITVLQNVYTKKGRNK